MIKLRRALFHKGAQQGHATNLRARPPASALVSPLVWCALSAWLGWIASPAAIADDKIDLLEGRVTIDWPEDAPGAPAPAGPVMLDLDMDLDITLEADLDLRPAAAAPLRAVPMLGVANVAEVAAELEVVAVFEEVAEAAAANAEKSGEEKKPAETEEEEKLTEEDIEDILGGADLYIEEMMGNEMELAYLPFDRYAQLDNERLEALRKARDETTKALIGEWRQEMREKIPSMSDRERQRMASGRVSQTPEPDIDNQKIWQEAIASLVTESEREAMEAGQKRQRLKRQESLARMLITALDPHLGFTENQRQTMLVMGTPLLEDLPENYFVPPAKGYAYVDITAVFTKVKESDRLTKLLSDSQRKSWNTLDANELNPNRGYSSRRMDPGDDAPEITTEREKELLIGRLLFQQAQRDREYWLKKMQSQLEVTCRVAKVSEDTRRLLLTVAKGTAEAKSTDSITNTHNNIWRQLKDVQPQDLKERMRNIHIPNYSRRYGRRSETYPFWEKTLEEILTEEQMAAIAEHKDASEAWGLKASASMVLTEMERYVAVPPLLRHSLSVRLEQAIEAYRPEFDNTFSPGWAFQGHYSAIPLEMIDGDDGKGLKAYLGPKQTEIIRGRLLTNTGQFLEQIRRQRGQRVGVPPFLMK